MHLLFFCTMANKCTQLFHKSHCYMFRHYNVILRDLVINSLPSYTSISNAAVVNTVYNQDVSRRLYVLKILQYWDFNDYNMRTCIKPIWNIVLQSACFLYHGRPSVCPSVHPYILLCTCLNEDFGVIWYCRLLRKCVEKIQIWLKSDKNIRHFTWRAEYVFFFIAGDMNSP